MEIVMSEVLRVGIATQIVSFRGPVSSEGYSNKLIKYTLLNVVSVKQLPLDGWRSYYKFSDAIIKAHCFKHFQRKTEWRTIGLQMMERI